MNNKKKSRFRSPFKMYKDWRERKRLEEEKKMLKREDQVCYYQIEFNILLQFIAIIDIFIR